MKKVFIFLTLFSLLIGNAFAADCTGSSPNLTAASASAADITACITAAVTGDTINVPQETVVWSGGISIPSAKKLTLQGAGKTLTLISGSGAIALNMSGSRLTGFGLTDIYVYADGNGFRIDNNNITFTTWVSGIQIMSRNDHTPDVPTGVIYENTLTNIRVLVSGTNYMLAGGNAQNVLWANSFALGNSNTVFIEDNTFATGTNAVDGNYGGSYVFRYNTLTKKQYVEAHSATSQRGMRRWEVYGNIIGNSESATNLPIWMRGGTGLIFGNLLSGNWTNQTIALDIVRLYSYDLCDGDSAWDGNTGAGLEAGYPCRDQIGRGYDSTQWEDSPAGAYAQPLTPAYFWNNKKTDGSTELTIQNPNGSSNHIQANRDYYNYNASFNGTTGTGCGALASRPATCTTGVGYWATDQSCSSLTDRVGVAPSTPISGTLYKCTATDTWTSYFTPYTYPHPLREATLYNLTVSKDGTGSGIVTANSGAVNCGDTCVGSYASTASVTLTASVEGNNEFAGWSGSGCSGTGTCVVAMSEARAVTATFNDTTPTNWIVQTIYAGTGTGVTSPVAGYQAYANNATATTTQTPGANSTFTAWSGTCGCTGAGACAPTITADCTIIATWTENTKYALAITQPETGIITSGDGYILCSASDLDCSHQYYTGEEVTLTVSGYPDNKKPEWSGTGGCTGNATTCEIVMDAAYGATATFSNLTGQMTIVR